MTDMTLALDLEGVLISNAVSQFPRPGLMKFLVQCELMFGRDNLCVFTTVDEKRFRGVASRLVANQYAPEWFERIRYVDWIVEHKDLRFVNDDISKVIIVDDYPPYIKGTQQHRLIQIKEYVDPYTHEAPDLTDREFVRVIENLKVIIAQ